MSWNQNYQPDSSGMRELANSPDMSRAMQQAAQVGQRWAEAEAPRDTGEYAGAFHVEAATVPAGRRRENRAGAALVNSAPHAGVVEARSGILVRSVNIIEGQR